MLHIGASRKILYHRCQHFQNGDISLLNHSHVLKTLYYEEIDKANIVHYTEYSHTFRLWKGLFCWAFVDAAYVSLFIIFHLRAQCLIYK